MDSTMRTEPAANRSSRCSRCRSRRMSLARDGASTHQRFPYDARPDDALGGARALVARRWAVLVYDPYDDWWHNAVSVTVASTACDPHRSRRGGGRLAIAVQDLDLDGALAEAPRCGGVGDEDVDMPTLDRPPGVGDHVGSRILPCAADADAGSDRKHARVRRDDAMTCLP